MTNCHVEPTHQEKRDLVKGKKCHENYRAY